jgi:hypothetical protein
MADSLILTFAEIEFLLQAATDPDPAIRARLRLSAEPNPQTAAAGVSSLLARGLCRLESGKVVPGNQIVAVTAALAGPHQAIEAAGWISGQPVLMHLLTGELVRLAVLPAAYGQFTVELLDPAEPVIVPLERFLDACTASNAEEAVGLRTMTPRGEVAIAVAIDPNGQWYVSDSEQHPERGEPVSREQAVERLRALLGPGTVAAGIS